MHQMNSGCRCPHHIGFGVLIILFGLTFLLQAVGVFSDTVVSYIWPSILIAGGLFKVISGLCSCCMSKMGGSCGGACGGSCAGDCGGSCSTEGADEGCCSDDMKGSCCEEEEEAHSHEEKK